MSISFLLYIVFESWIESSKVTVKTLLNLILGPKQKLVGLNVKNVQMYLETKGGIRSTKENGIYFSPVLNVQKL